MNHHTHSAQQRFETDTPPLMIATNDEVLRLMETRRSVPLRMLAGPGPTPEETERLLAIAARIPDHGRLVPWRFILIEGDGRGELGSLLDQLYARKTPDLAAGKTDMWRDYLLRAPLTVVIVSRADPSSKVPVWNQQLSAGCAGMALTLAAHAIGFSTQWLLKWPGRDADAAALLGVTRDETVAGFIHIGRPRAMSEDRARPALDQIVTRWSAEDPIKS